MIRCPIDYFTDNIIFNADKSCWAAFSLAGFDYDFLSTEGKIKILYKTARFLSGIMSDAQILIIPIEQSLKEHFNGLRMKVKEEDPLYKHTQNLIDLTEDYLQQSVKAKGASNDYRTYIIIKLDNTDSDVITEAITSVKEKVQYFLKNPMNAINVWMNLDTKDILLSQVNICIKMAAKWYQEQNLRIEMQKCDVEEVQWLFRRIAYRGLTQGIKLFYKSQDKKQKWHPKCEKVKVDTETIVKPLKRDIVNLFSGAIKSRNRVVTVETDSGTSYQTFLVLTNIPDEYDFPVAGMEWIYMLQKYDYQAEVCIQVKATEYKTGLHDLELKKREIDSQMDNIASAKADIPDDLADSKVYADAMESELKEARDPILKTSVSICLAADNRDLLEQKVTNVKNYYEDRTFVIERPLTDQTKLFMQFIPSVSATIKDFVMPLTPRLLASGIIGATHELGDNVGPYIGTTGYEEKNVFLDMGLACLKNKSASATFFGNLGVGKSFNANLLLVLNIIYGGYGLIFDPKGERSHWEKDLKILKGLIKTVSLSSDPEYKGKLDPYNIYREDLSLANELALNVISELFKISPTSEEYTALLEAARIIKTKENKNHSMLEFSDILNNFPEDDDLHDTAKMLSRRLQLQQEAGMSQLLIGDGTEEAIKLDNRLNILQIQNLKLPSPETKKEDYTSEETLSTVIMMVLSHFAKKFALVKRPVFKIVLFDESWALGKTAEGVKLYDYLARMGRSLYTGIIFNGHSVLDIPTEGIKNTITYKFCFQTGNDNEADRMLDYLGLENTEDNRGTVKNLENGTCLFQDLSGHVGILHFDAVFQDIIDVFKTTPTTETETPQNKEDENEPKEEIIEEKMMEASEVQPEDQKDGILEGCLNVEDFNINIYQKEEV